MTEWHFLVDRADFRNTRIVESPAADLSDGQIRVRVDAFGFTANNVTYAAAGDMIGYWKFFPAPETDDGVEWGRVPVWGFGDVIESHSDLVIGGDRLFGYFPMSTELVIEPTRVTDSSLSDGAAHRADLPPVYNRYTRTGGDPTYRAELEAEQMLYFPLFFTSFLIDDFLDDHELFGAATVVIGSASSKTAFGTAHLLAQRPGVQVVGLTSPGNVEFVEQLGCYAAVFTYDDAADLPDGPAVFVDMSGNRSVMRAVHERYGDDLTHSMIVGMTHWENRDDDTGGALPGPPPTMFFAPSQIEKRRADWGPGKTEEKLAAAWGPFLEQVAGWVAIEHGEGPEAVAEVYRETLEGATSPDVAHILHP